MAKFNLGLPWTGGNTQEPQRPGHERHAPENRVRGAPATPSVA